MTSKFCLYFFKFILVVVYRVVFYTNIEVVLHPVHDTNQSTFVNDAMYLSRHQIFEVVLAFQNNPMNTSTDLEGLFY